MARQASFSSRRFPSRHAPSGGNNKRRAADHNEMAQICWQTDARNRTMPCHLIRATPGQQQLARGSDSLAQDRKSLVIAIKDRTYRTDGRSRGEGDASIAASLMFRIHPGPNGSSESGGLPGCVKELDISIFPPLGTRTSMPGGDRPQPRLTNPAEAANAASSPFEAMPAGRSRACLVSTAAELSVVRCGRRHGRLRRGRSGYDRGDLRGLPASSPGRSGCRVAWSRA